MAIGGRSDQRLAFVRKTPAGLCITHAGKPWYRIDLRPAAPFQRRHAADVTRYRFAVGIAKTTMGLSGAVHPPTGADRLLIMPAEASKRSFRISRSFSASYVCRRLRGRGHAGGASPTCRLALGRSARSGRSRRIDRPLLPPSLVDFAAARGARAECKPLVKKLLAVMPYCRAVKPTSFHRCIRCLAPLN